MSKKDGRRRVTSWAGRKRPGTFPRINEREVITKDIGGLYAATDTIVQRRMWMVGGLAGAVIAGCIVLVAAASGNNGLSLLSYMCD